MSSIFELVRSMPWSLGQCLISAHDHESADDPIERLRESRQHLVEYEATGDLYEIDRDSYEYNAIIEEQSWFSGFMYLVLECELDDALDCITDKIEGLKAGGGMPCCVGLE